MEQRRYLRCLGQPVLFAPTGEPIRFRTKKHLALLIYIAVEAKSHRRDRLAELLWPKVSPAEARHSLATALSTLRPRLGPDGLESSRDHVHLAPGRVSIDLERLEQGDVLGNELTEPLEVAAFLDGFDVPDSAEFSHWKDRQQARLLPMIKDALVLLIDRCRRTGDTRQIERLADRMLALDDLSEEAIRAKMEARAFAGDRLTALEMFEAWKTKLADELQAAPSDLVEGMAVRLRRRGWERTTLPKIPNVPTDQWRGRPFIGRTTEYRLLYEAWEEVRGGIPQHVLILGDSGVGKTTLAERLTTAIGLEGAVISRVQCYDLEREIPYSTLSGLVLGLLECPGVSATAPEALSEIARMVPEVRRRFPSLPMASESQGETARIRLTAGFLEMLSAIADEHPVVIVVDDLHFADDVSLAVLHLVMRRAKSQKIMVLLIARSGQLSHSTRLKEGVVPLTLFEIELSPLREDESIEMLNSLIPPGDAHPSLPEQRTLLRAAAGYPMALELLAQDWKISGKESQALSVDAMTADFSGSGSGQHAYQQIFTRITGLLSPTTHNVLNLASILGRRLNDFDLYGLVDLSVGQTLSAMTELVNQRVLRDGPQGLEFVNEVIRTAAYLRVPATVRRLLHGSIADCFVRRYSGGDTDLCLEIAWHSIRAGRIADATPYLLQGARQAIRSGAPFEAERSLTTALPQLAGPEKPQALILIVEALQEQSRWAESLHFLDKLAGCPDINTNDLAFVLRTIAIRRLGYLDSSELAELPSKLVLFIESSADRRSRIRAAVEVASLLNMLRLTTDIPRVLNTLFSFPCEDLGPDDIGHFLLAKSMLFYNISDFDNSLACIQEATSLLEKENTLNSILAMLQNGVGAILTRQGAYQDSTVAYLKCQQTALQVGNDSTYLQASANLALSLTRLGEYEKALQWAERPLMFDAADVSPGFLFQAAESAVLSYAMLGRSAETEAVILKRREEFARFGLIGISQAWALYAADGYSLLGRESEAEEEGRRGTEGINARLHLDFCAGPYARWLARTSLTQGKLARCYEKLDFLKANLKNYDSIDQVEILIAKSWLDSRARHASVRDVEEIIQRLAQLPKAIGQQLMRLGMLEFIDWSFASRSILPDAGTRPANTP